MKNLILIIAITLSTNVLSQVDKGQKITAKKFNGSSHHLGDVKKSLLTLTQYQSLAGDCWVKINGQDITGSDYALLTGKTTLPLGEGVFFRNTGGNAAILGEIQGDAIRNITGALTSNYITSSPDNQSGALRSFVQQYNNRYGYTSGTYWGGAVDFDASRVVPTANENRPKNIALNHFVKINNECN